LKFQKVINKTLPIGNLYLEKFSSSPKHRNMSENDQIKVLVFLKKQVEEEMKKNKTLQDENLSLTQKLEKKTKELELSSSQKESTKKKIEELESNLHVLTEVMKNSEDGLAKKSEEVYELRDENQQLASEIHSLKQEFSKKNHESVAYLSEIEDNKRLMKELEETLNEMVEKVEVTKKELQTKEEEILKLNEKNIKLKKFVDEVSLLVSQKAMKIVQLEKDLKSSFSATSSFSNPQELLDLKKKLESQMKEKEELELNLTEMKSILKTNESEIISAFLSKVSNTTGINEIKEISNSEQSTNDLVEKFSSFLSIRDSTAGLKPNEMKLSLANFKSDDIVLFMKDSRGNWEIFNRNCGGYFLSTDAVEELKKKDGYKELLSVVAKILYIEEEVSQKNNDYGFIAGQKFSRVYIYPFEK
jgi:myosin heavy subunit